MRHTTTKSRHQVSQQIMDTLYIPGCAYGLVRKDLLPMMHGVRLIITCMSVLT